MSNVLRAFCVAGLFVLFSPFALAQSAADNPAARQTNIDAVAPPQTDVIDRGAIVGDPSFETGSPNASWAEGSTNFGTPLCTVGFCGMGGSLDPDFDGEWWAWFGGINAVETGFVSQDVTIPSGSADLTFYLEIPVADNPGFLDVSLDGNVVFSVTEADQATYATYQQVTVNIDAFADGGLHTLRFDSTVQPGVGVTNFFLDLVEITAGGGDPFQISATPPTQTVAAGGQASFQVTVTNKTNNTQSGVLCYKAGPLAPVQVVSGSLNPQQTRTVPVNINVPGSTPANTYNVQFRIGPNCSTIVASTTVQVTVTNPGIEADAPLADWTLTETVVWPTEAAARTSEIGAYPNPFVDRTEIAYTLEEGAQVQLTVYDVLGREVAVLTDEVLEAGTHTATFEARGLATGTYIYRLVAGNEVQSGRITLMK